MRPEPTVTGRREKQGMPHAQRASNERESKEDPSALKGQHLLAQGNALGMC